VKLTVAASMIGAVWASTLASAQVPSMSTEGHRDTQGNAVYETYLAGQIKVLSDISPVENKAFSCIPVVPLNHLGYPKKGDVLAAQVSADRAWSVDYYMGVEIVTVQLKIGNWYYDFPRLGVVNKQTVFPANLTAKVAIEPGAVLHFDGYEVRATRSVKARDSVPVIVVGDAILSAEAAEGAKTRNDVRPWFTAFKKDVQSKENAAAIEAWRIVRNHVGL